MIYETHNNLSLFRFDNPGFENPNHGFFTRNGGVSTGPWTSLNVGGTNGDSNGNVIENRRRIFESIGRPVESIFDVWQVHDNGIICTDTPRPLGEPHQKADAIFTNNPEVTLFMRFADCVPILVYDPTKKIVGIIHAGWQGTVKKIVSTAIQKIIHHYNVDPGDLYAGIGPSIGPDHYEVSKKIIDRVKLSFQGDGKNFLKTREGSTRLDLWQANEYLLSEAGVKHIYHANLCTACDPENWFSHRGENGNTGRFAAVISING